MAQESKAAEAQSASSWASSRVARGRVVVVVVACPSPPPAPSLLLRLLLLLPSGAQRRSAAEAAAGATLSPSPPSSSSTLAKSTFHASRTFGAQASEDPPFGPASSVTVAANEPASYSGESPP